MNFHEVLLHVWAVFLAVGPILGYIPQYIDIKRSRHYQGFSSVICLILLISNILRILSYFLQNFDEFLLAQSVFMVTVQLLMLNLIVKLAARDISPPTTATPHSSVDSRSFFSSFWAWKSFIEYVIFLALFTAFFGSIVLVEKFLYPSKLIQISFLYTSTLIESTLCMPQALTNWRNKSTFGLNKSLVASWISGDAFKLGYYILSEAPLPFTICAIIQLIVDFVIISQIIYYSFVNVEKEGEISRQSSMETVEKPFLKH